MKLFSAYSLVKLLVGVSFILSIASVYSKGTTPVLAFMDYMKAIMGTGDVAVATMNSSSMMTRGMFDNGIGGIIAKAGEMLGIDVDPLFTSVDKSGLGNYIDTIEDLSNTQIRP